MEKWYEESFKEDYLIVYKHRDIQGAKEEVRAMANWLELPQQADVLDLCCGMGRHSLALNSFGYKVTGVDLSEVLLAEAKRLDSGGDVRWVHGDMRDVPLDESFDAVVNLFTSFGYFDEDEESFRVITEIERLLKDGGKFIIDYLNPAYVASRLNPYSERKQDGLLIQESRSIEDGFVRKRITVKDSRGEDRSYLEQVRLFGLEEFRAMIARCALRIEHVYGGYDGSDYGPDSPRLILVGHKQGGEQ